MSGIKLTPKQRLGEGRKKACDILKYFSSMIMRMSPIETRKPGFTAAVDARARFFWNPDFLESFPAYVKIGYTKIVFKDGRVQLEPEGMQIKTDAKGAPLLQPMPIKWVAFTVAHEAVHLVQRHNQRRDQIQADPYIWNLAADVIDNNELKAAGFEIIPGCVSMESLPFTVQPGITVAPLYQKLMEWKRQEEQKQPQESKPKTPGSPGPGKAVVTDEIEPGIGTGGCGGCAGHSSPEEEEESQKRDAQDTEALNKDKPDPNKIPAGASEGELDTLRSQCAKEYKASKKGRGTGAGAWDSWAEETLLPPKIPWTTVLFQYARAAVAYVPGGAHPRFDRPNRRFSRGQGHPILPRTVTPIPKILMVADSSGSVSNEELTRYASEGEAILRAVRGDLTVMVNDAAVQSIKDLRSGKDIHKEIHKGRGGTDFRPVFEKLPELRPHPSVVVFFTDGGGPAPLHPPPNVTVIWVLVGGHKQKPYAVAHTTKEDAGGYGGEHGEISWGRFIWVDD